MMFLHFRESLRLKYIKMGKGWLRRTAHMEVPSDELLTRGPNKSEDKYNFCIYGTFRMIIALITFFL